MRLSFGDFVVDFDERRLFSGRQEIRLTPKAFELRGRGVGNLIPR
jgi:DNA-binding response OmpR family regulator